ncbi:MAG: YitT family protein [Bacilli bacterium]|nr:YitT family protein [Bacilli bacterium]
MSYIRNKKFEFIVSFVLLTFGSLIAAIALSNFLLPNNILDGGVNGISFIVSKLTNFSLPLLVILFNIPFMFVGYKSLGKSFLYRTIYSVVAFSCFLSIFEHFGSFTNEILLATVFGGLLLGVGVGIIIRFGGCIDGTESLAMVISKKTNLSVGQIILVCNLIIYTVGGFIFGWDRAMYSLLTYVITFKFIDAVSEGLEQAKAALIITEKGTKLSKEIYKKLGRTTTTIKAKGLISGDKEVLYCVLTRIELFELRHLVEQMDESAFVTVLEVSDIIGSHIKSTAGLRKILNKK